MIDLVNKNTKNSLGMSLWRLLRGYDDLTDKELVINSNSSNKQTIFLDCIKKIEVHDESVLFYGKYKINDFLNLKNVLSISIVGDLDE